MERHVADGHLQAVSLAGPPPLPNRLPWRVAFPLIVGLGLALWIPIIYVLASLAG